MAQERTLTKGSKFAIATARCKAMGHKHFGEGSAGKACRERIAESIAGGTQIVPGPAMSMKDSIKRRMAK